METTPSIYPAKLLDAVVDLGFDANSLARKCGITQRSIQDRNARIPISNYLRLVRSALTATKRSDLGFLVGAKTTALDHGVLGYALLGYRDFGESLKRYLQFQHLQGPLLEIDIGVDGRYAYLAATPTKSGLQANLVEYFVQEWLIGWLDWRSILNVRGSFFSSIELSFSSDLPIAVYEDRLQTSVSFNSTTTRAYFPKHRLQRELNHNYATVASLCAGQCEDLLSKAALNSGIIGDVLSVLVVNPGRKLRMPEVAGKLSLSVRTLRRRLQEAETTFDDIASNHTLDLARRYLVETDLSVNDIARSVGYANPANLYRRFLDEEGTTPLDYRLKSRALSQ